MAEHAFAVFDKDQDGYISLTDVSAVLEQPHVRDFEDQSGVDYLDLIRPVFLGKGPDGKMGFGEFETLLGSSSETS